MTTHALTETIVADGKSIPVTQEFTGDGDVGREIAVASDASDLAVNLAIDFSQIQSLWISADQDLTLETNSDSAPDDTIALKGGKPLHWEPDSYYDCPLTADVTVLYVTNGSAVACTLKIEVLEDATP